jgi:RNA polymerase sigma-70 factor (ECF subfamily)
MEQRDQVYVDRVLQGEVNAFSPLVHKHKDLVFSICLRVLQNREEAEEAAQDTFLKAYRALDKYRGSAAFSTWLYRIAYNNAISRTRKKKWEWVGEDGEMVERMAEEAPEEEGFEMQTEAREALLKGEIEKLDEASRLLIELFYVREQSTEAISEITGLSVSNVKVRLHRIRKKLGEAMAAPMAELNERRE